MGCDRLGAQIAGAVVMSQTAGMYGIIVSFAGMLLAESQSGGSAAQMTIGEATLIASISHLGRVIGSILSAPLTDRLGVLRVLQLSAPLSLASWPLITLGSRDMMLAGTISAGVVIGLTASVCRLYIAEVSSARARGVLCNLPGMAIALGLLINFSLSDLLPWRYATLLCGCVPLVTQLIGTILLPNSPRWLTHRGAGDEVVSKAITFFHGKKVDIAWEVKEIQKSLKGRPL
ncbi:sugar transporter ERD6-like 6 [Pollicipes pollicipes]|uniref:sugar transporter ERD6-like 6 n=1 Tax=Pollicipes pollicipes TaxID=41117 RepID=UPI0018856694|nr:sugar transporter ERD6-like 6 [Pollicipes pollicipes]